MPGTFEDLPDEWTPGGYEVAPTRLGRTSRRSTWLVRLAAVGAAAVVVVAAIGSGDEAGPAFDPRRPAATEAIRSAGPSIERPVVVPALPPIALGPADLPGRPIPLLDRALAMLDPASGQRGPDILEPGANGEVLLDAEGRFVCVCLDDPWVPAGARVAIAIRRYDPVADRVDGGDRAMTLISRSDPRGPGGSIRLGATLSPDGRRVFVASVRLAEDRWVVALDTLGVPDGRRLDSRILATYAAPVESAADATASPGASGGPPSGGPTRPIAIGTPIVRASPDGRTVRVGANYQETLDGGFGLLPRWRAAWRVRLDGEGVPAEFALLDESPVSASGSCPWEGYVAADRYLRVCRTSGIGGGAITELRVEGDDGSARSSQPIADADSPGVEAPLVDAAHGRVYLWVPGREVLIRLDAVSGALAVMDSAAPAPGGQDGLPTGRWPAPGGDPVHWTSLGGAGDRFNGSIVGSPHGSVLYAAGGSVVDGSAIVPMSTGIWVFDAASLSLIARWPAATAYRELAIADQGRAIAALGASGQDAAGRSAAWGIPLTIHDARTGEVAVTYGDVARGPSVRLPGPGR